MCITNLTKYYTEKLLNLKIIKPLFPLEEYKGNKFKYKWQCLECDKEFIGYIKNGQIPRCLKCNPIPHSLPEQELQNWLEQYIPIERNKRYFENSRYKYELDIFIPSLNLGIEHGGLWHHSEIGGGKDCFYHIKKMNIF